MAVCGGGLAMESDDQDWEARGPFEKLKNEMDDALTEWELFRYVDALLSSVHVSLATGKIGNEEPIFLGRLRESLTAKSYRDLCSVIHLALERERSR
jgi:hypothetical protein